jgi:hypothetical protein
VRRLPADYSTPSGEQESWEATLGYLRALEKAEHPVVLAVVDPHRQAEDLHRSDVMRQIGFLRVRPDRPNRPEDHLFELNWPDPDQPCGYFTVDERLFNGATLHTNDGDDYFILRLDLGTTVLELLDSNINMEHAYGEWQQRRQKTAEPDEEVLRLAKATLAETRAALVERGATAAKDMSDAELEAVGLRVTWSLRSSGRMSKVPRSEWNSLWLDEFAQKLRGGAD